MIDIYKRIQLMTVRFRKSAIIYLPIVDPAEV
jgi:hypothetical protein